MILKHAIDAFYANLPGSTASRDRLWRAGVTGGFKIGNGLFCPTGGFTNAKAGHTINIKEGLTLGTESKHPPARIYTGCSVLARRKCAVGNP
jgi:hypothetical protein